MLAYEGYFSAQACAQLRTVCQRQLNYLYNGYQPTEQIWYVFGLHGLEMSQRFSVFSRYPFSSVYTCVVHLLVLIHALNTSLLD